MISDPTALDKSHLNRALEVSIHVGLIVLLALARPRSPANPSQPVNRAIDPDTDPVSSGPRSA